MLLESRQIPKWFKIIDVTNNKEVDNASLDIQSDKKLVALFRTFDEAKDKMEYYATPFYTLGMKIEMKIDVLNEINEILSSETFIFE